MSNNLNIFSLKENKFLQTFEQEYEILSFYLSFQRFGSGLKLKAIFRVGLRKMGLTPGGRVCRLDFNFPLSVRTLRGHAGYIIHIYTLLYSATPAF